MGNGDASVIILLNRIYLALIYWKLLMILSRILASFGGKILGGLVITVVGLWENVTKGGGDCDYIIGLIF